MMGRRMQHGFALLLTLVLVLLAGTLMAAIAWRSAFGAVETQEAVEELQRRWAITSCQATLLEHAEELLDEVERGEPSSDKTSPDESSSSRPSSGKPPQTYKNKPVLERRLTCQLAGRDYDLVLTDEQAKLNVNSVLQASNSGQTRLAVTHLLDQSGGDVAPVVLRTLSTGRQSPSAGTRLLPIGCYGQIFDEASPERLVGSEIRKGLIASLTCWGDGRVSLRRAGPEVIEAACEKALGRDGVASLLAVRNRDPYRKLAAIMGEMAAIDPRRKVKIDQYFTDQSECHGLWVIAKGSQRSWYNLAISVGDGSATSGDPGGRSVAQRYYFSW